MFHLNGKCRFFNWLPGVVAGGALFCAPLAASAASPEPHAQHTSMGHQTPEWAEKLKAQTVVEDAMEGRPNRAAQVDMQHERIMHQMANDPQAQQVSTGMYNSMSMLHQYGAGNQEDRKSTRLNSSHL